MSAGQCQQKMVITNNQERHYTNELVETFTPWKPLEILRLTWKGKQKKGPTDEGIMTGSSTNELYEGTSSRVKVLRSK